LEFSSPEGFRHASGPSNWNQQQGFYIYRADRMIQSGGWCRLRTQDEHTKLARVALSFPPKLDSAFKINVAKMRVQLPLQLRDQIEAALRPVIKAAQERYRTTSKKHQTSSSTDYPPSSSESHLAAAQPPAKYKGGAAPVERTWTLEEIENALNDAAAVDEKPIIAKVMAKVRRKLSPTKTR
jgi:hypothetical protein